MKNMLAVLCLFISVSTLASIPKLEQKDFASLLKTANNTARPMTERWQSLIKAGEIAEPEQIIKIQEFSKSSDWFMRNASLVALETIHADYGIEQAKILIQDKALVVRSAAVKTLTKKNSLDVRRILAGEMSKPYNYSGQQSLWIRSQIMQQLAKTATSQDRQFLARHLFDTDKKVVQLSASALEKISSVQFMGDQRIQQWQKFVKENKWL